MSINPVDDDCDYSPNQIDKKEGSDGQRAYVLLENHEHSSLCSDRFGMLGIEKIGFKVYQLAETKFFDMDFDVVSSEGKACLHFPNNIASANGNVDFLLGVEKVATAAQAFGLADLANHGVVLAKSSGLPPNIDSAYLRCMNSCDDIEFELFKLLCWLACDMLADKTPGT